MEIPLLHRYRCYYYLTWHAAPYGSRLRGAFPALVGASGAGEGVQLAGAAKAVARILLVDL